MAYIDSNQHCSHAVHHIWHLHLVKITSNLAVYLSQDVGCLRHIERAAIATGDHLGGNLVHGANLLYHLVVSLSIDNTDGNLRVLETSITIPHHEVEKFLLHLSGIVLSSELDHGRVFYSNLEHSTGLFER